MLSDEGLGHLSKCSNISESIIRKLNWVHFSVATGGWLIVAFIFVIVMIRREFKSVIERFFIYLLISTLLRETVLISNVVNQFQYYEYMSQVCAVLGGLDLYTAILVLIFITSTVFYLLSRVTNGFMFFQQNCACFFELGFVVFVFLFPLIICMALLYANLFGLSAAWCWVKEFDKDCHRIDAIKRFFGGYSVILAFGVVSIILMVKFMVVYCKLSRKISAPTHLLKQAMILIACLVINVVILVFAFIVVNLAHIDVIFIYIYTTVISLYDIIYPIGFLVVVKYQALCTVMNKRKQSTYAPLAKTQNATAPFSDRVSARSTTVPISAPYTGGFTEIN